MKKSILFTIFGISLLMADSDIVADTSIYDEDGFKRTQTEPYNPPSQQINYRKDTIYIERKAKLMWQDEKYTDEERRAYYQKTSSGKAGTWGHANIYCKSLDYASYSNWRLPTLDELMNLHEYHNSGIKHSEAVDFWTSTPHREDNYWSVFLGDGYGYIHDRDDVQYFRCVREYDKNADRHSAVGRIKI